ncbi:MAG: ABC transporter substrate-binding protein [Deltaproteobacteria bacterium]|nr:ABC transporter substrate-binding protein [Deltaproteobacteria bacterium]
MKKEMMVRVGMLFLLCVFYASSVWGGVPTEKIKETTDNILAIITRPELKGPAKAMERRKLIRRYINERFDWEEMSRRSLGRHWRKRTKPEKATFVTLFGKLLERTYLDKVEGYSGEKVDYLDETLDGDYGNVKVKILTPGEHEVNVEYRMKKKNNDWLVYDISIEGVSLINNYRVQFNSIITRSSYNALVRRLEEKVSQE